MRPIPAAVVGVLAAAVIGGCATAGGSQQLDPSQADATIAADRLAFESTELRVPAERPLTILFQNREAAIHNVAIYRDETARDALFVGEFIGTGQILYAVEPLPPGTYFFRCDLHPTMTGKIVAD